MNARDEYAELYDLVIEDMEATADEYREDDWETLVLHLEEVRPVYRPADKKWDKTLGFVGTADEDEYEEAHKIAYRYLFDEYETYRAQEGDVVFIVLVMEDTDNEVALLMPLFYEVEEARELLEAAEEEGEIRTYLHPPDDKNSIVFEHQDPSAFYPENW